MAFKMTTLALLALLSLTSLAAGQVLPATEEVVPAVEEEEMSGRKLLVKPTIINLKAHLNADAVAGVGLKINDVLVLLGVGLEADAKVKLTINGKISAKLDVEVLLKGKVGPTGPLELVSILDPVLDLLDPVKVNAVIKLYLLQAGPGKAGLVVLDIPVKVTLHGTSNGAPVLKITASVNLDINLALAIKKHPGNYFLQLGYLPGNLLSILKKVLFFIRGVLHHV
eukprot:jgi/Mesen1/7674/ME000401S07011